MLNIWRVNLSGNNNDNLYHKLSEERKYLQKHGELPDWMTTGGWQLLKAKYLDEGQTFRDRATVIAKAAAAYRDKESEERFFNMLWKGWLSCSTPVLANMGTNKGLPVSCSGGYVDDSVDGFFTSRRETALLTKYGFGTSSYLGDVRSRGSPISVGGRASGVLPVLKGFVQDSQDITQGQQRRGAWAGYLPVHHGDFWEVINYLANSPDDLNIGWIIDDKFISLLDAGDAEAIARYQRMLKVKMLTGKGYFCFIDKINRARPEAYKKNNLHVTASNLCDEISLFSDKDHTFTCVLSSLNLAKYNEWESTFAVYDSIDFLDCVASEFIEKAKGISGLENAVRMTEKGRAVGLGVCGWHTLLQQRGIPWESLEAGYLNSDIFRTIFVKARDASCSLGAQYGFPEWSHGMRNTHVLAIAPTKSTALIMGGVSEGINPDPAMTYTQSSAGGEINRVNPVLLGIMKSRDVYNDKTVQSLVDKQGSVQHVDWLSDQEKRVFKTAFEIDQRHVLRHAKMRAKYLDQWQSVNLFFSDQTPEQEISEIHQQAFKDEDIRGLYYIYSKSGIAPSGECEVCM